METKNLKNILLLAAALVLSHQAKAWEFNAEVDIKTSTKYHDCQGYAANIVDLCKLFLSTGDIANKSFVEEQIKLLRKSLKKCEKRNSKKSYDNGVKIGFSHEIK